MKLVIAEKPSVAQSLAAVIGATARKDGYLEGNGWRVSWCVGHLAGLADADSYDPKYAKWRYDDLPILPEHWQMVVGKDKKKQFDILKKLMNAPDVTEVVNACDAGREGELIFRSVYELAGCQKPMKRLWISSMEDSAIREGFANLRPGADYDGLRDAALCRAKADWLVGINATRLFSVLYHRTLNIGRVMSPTLALIVQREAEIDTFKPVPFYKKSFQAVVDDINMELNIHELDTSYNIVYLNALGISYTANSEGANDKGFSFMAVAGILVGSLILLAAGLVIYNILKISVSKRIKGYGTLRAIGSEKGQLYQIIVIEVTLLCLIGIPIGMLLGFLSARGILEAATGLVSPELFLVQDSSELKTLIAENSSLNGTLLILSGAITLAFALFAALPAARSAARVSPIMAMSGTNLKIRRRKRKTKKIHNFEAYYARLNLKRNKGRTAITILSLVMSITVFIALQGFSSLLNAASALQDNHVGDYQITNESIGFTTDDLNTLRKNEAVQSVAAIQFSLYEQNENGLLDEISLEFQLKPGETFQVVGLNDEYWDYFMGDQLPEEQLGQLKAGNACIVRNPIPMSYGEDVLKFTNIEAGENICVAGMELNVLKTLDGYDGYLGIGNGGFTNGVQVIVDDAIYERLTGKDTYSEFLPTLNEGVDRESFDTFVEDFCKRVPGTTFLSYEETDQQLKESFAQIQMLAWGLILFVGLIGILNIINTVYTNIHTRVTEIGMQRAIGMSAESLYKTFLWEGAYYGIIASVIGSVLGYVCTIFIEAATSDTLQLVAIPVIPILEATLLAVGACLMATAIPLRKISKMSIVDSIETVE